MSRETDKNGLLSCPFCWGPAELTYNSEHWPVVQCDNCGAQGPCIELDKSKAIAAWNDRAGA
jgi:Lar family restriction alleviation protein